jgi:hypothetical protein
VADAKRRADVVFAGRVEEVALVDSDKWEPRAVFRFKVARVWKGEVTESFLMHTNLEASSCAGFFRSFAKPGTVLLVYGYEMPAAEWKRGGMAGAENAGSFTVRPKDGTVLRQDLVDAVPDDGVVYTTDICTRTMPVAHAVEDFEELGKARELGPLDELPDPVLVESMRFIPNKLPGECEELHNGRAWTRVRKPPENAAHLVETLEKGPWYASIPKPLNHKYKDYWSRNAEGGIGFCRLAVDSDVTCGAANGEFRKNEFTGEWYFTGSVRTYCTNPDGSRYEPAKQ